MDYRLLVMSSDASSSSAVPGSPSRPTSSASSNTAAGFLSPKPPQSVASLPPATATATTTVTNAPVQSAKLLLQIASKCEGLSGRSLRKLPFQAHAFFLQSPSAALAEFLRALELAVDLEAANRLVI